MAAYTVQGEAQGDSRPGTRASVLHGARRAPDERPDRSSYTVQGEAPDVLDRMTYTVQGEPQDNSRRVA